MQKIMFNDKYGLTQAVLEGRKTNTRRIIDAPSNTLYMKPVLDLCGNIIKVYALDPDGRGLGVFFPKYRVGEVVAVAQSYHAIFDEMMCGSFGEGYGDGIYDAFRNAMVADKAGWNNKMFVKAELMPHRIRFTGLRVERLQDISDEDCLREGVYEYKDELGSYGFSFKHPNGHVTLYTSPRGAFAALIDKVSCKGTWGNNPWVFVYEFELVK